MTQATPRTITLHAHAPPKPAWGEPCNGCGVCCLAEPCPIGILVSARRCGACRALAWDDPAQRYVCGVLTGRRELLPAWLRPIAPWLQRRAPRWIAAGSGCDCDFELGDV